MRKRIFLVSWVLFGMMFATNIVREHYPALALVEDGTYRLDRYRELHSDIFEHRGRSYINNNVGASVIAALPLLPFKPVLAKLDERGRLALERSGGQIDTSFDTRYPNRERLYRLVRQSGWELKFGALAAITALLLMAPLSALFVVLVRDFLIDRGVGPGRATTLAFLFGFATPVLFRTAHLNHNMIVMYGAFGAFLALAPRGAGNPLAPRPGALRNSGAGVLGGVCVMCDYSGVVPLGWLALWTLWGASRSRRVVDPLAFAAGAALPILVQLHSQWVSFGSWIHPPATWMAAANFTDRGYRGFDWPAPDLFRDNLFERRWGLFAYAPLLLLGLVPPRRDAEAVPLPRRAWMATMTFAFTFLLFAAANQYGRMQWNTGVRYLMPVVPVFFLAAANHLARMRGRTLLILGTLSALHAWVVSMRRTVSMTSDGISGVLEDWRLFLTEGPRLPWLDVLGRTATGRDLVPAGSIAHVALILATLLVVALAWRLSRPRDARATTQPPG